jgi:ABC-2 type transport system permease protein
MELNVIYVLVAREFKKFTRERSRLVSAIARPLLWLFLVGAGMSRLVSPDAGMPYTQFIFPGILGMTILFSSIFSSISIIWDKEFGFFKEILAAPVSRLSIVVGKGLSGTVVSTLQAAIVLMLFPLLGFVIALAMSFCISTFGILLASFYDSYESFSVIMNFIVMPMFFLSGAMYPVKLLPKPLGVAAALNPLTYGVDALKNIIFPLEEGPMSADFSLLTDVTVILILSTIFVVVGAKLFERKS